MNHKYLLFASDSMHSGFIPTDNVLEVKVRVE